MEAGLQIHHDSDLPISIVQITDSHLGGDAGAEVLGMNTDYSLECVLELIERQHPDLLLCTGDLSNNGSAGAYERFRSKVQVLNKFQAWLPGNHDRPDVMKKTCQSGDELNKVVTIGRWQIVMLDSSVPDKVEGKLAESELGFLEDHLKNNTNYHQLICLHHHVLPVGCAWLDAQRTANASLLLDLLTEYPQVKGLLSGHVHQVFERQFQGFKVMTSPSTCIQFAQGSEDFRIDHCNPGYRWLQLLPQGEIKTGIERVTGVTFAVDYDSHGY